MIKVTFDRNGNLPGPSGIVSFASWDNPDLHKALRQCFHESPREEISEIHVDDKGIKAVFVVKNATNG